MNEEVKDWMKLNPEVYEWFLVLAADHDKKLWYQMEKYLCKDRDKRWENHFSSRSPYIIYRAIHNWRVITHGAEFTPVSVGALRSGILNLIIQGIPLITMSTGEQIISEYEKVKGEYHPEDAIAVVRDSWRTWVRSKKTIALGSALAESGIEVDTSGMLSTAIIDIHEVENDAEAGGGRQDMDFCEVRRNELPPIIRRPLGKDFSRLNEVLGGGIGSEEHYLGVIPTGGGKTTLCCQIAASVAAQGGHVAYISTEQRPSELVPRIYSYMSYTLSTYNQGEAIPFALIKDGITKESLRALSPSQLDTLDVIDQRIDKRIHFGDWTCDRSEEEMETFVKEMILRHGQLDLLIVDWLGGSFTASAKDTGALRLTLNRLAKRLSDMSKEYKLPVLSMCQASKDGIDVMKVTEKYIADCKTIHTSVTMAFGISTLRRNVEKSGEEQVYDDKQFITVFKSRRGKPMYWPIYRFFDYQMFKGL